MSIVGKSMFPLQSNFTSISQIQSRLSSLQTQLGTGQKASTLAGMGDSRGLSLQLRARLSAIEGYQQSIATVNVRLGVMDQVIGRLDAIEASQRISATPGAYGTGNINLTTVTSTSKSRLDEVLAVLNSDAGGRYLFGGDKTDTRPVATVSAILDGENGKAGFRTVVSERSAADAGLDGRGRVTVGASGDTATLSEDGAHPFGFKLGAVSSSGANVTLAQPNGTAPQSVSVRFDAQPVAGQTVTIGLTLPDGSSEAVTLTAVTGPPGPGEFQVGADPGATAGNFADALGARLEALGSTALAAASSHAAAENFFNGQNEQVMRVAGGPPATSLVAATDATTVMWYRGADATDARGSVGAKVDDGSVVRYGVQANEAGIVNLVRSLAAMSVETFPAADPTSQDRFDAMASRQIGRLSEGNNSMPGSIEVIAVDLGMARATAGNAAERLTAFTGQVQNMLADAETVDLEAVAMEILSAKTRLEASYAATSMVAQLSLVNFMR